MVNDGQESVFITTVRSTHLDRFGHVNNARYLEFLEWARWEWASEAGIDFEELMAGGLDPAVVRIEIDYRRQLFFRDEVVIRTRVREIGTRRIVLEQLMEVDGHRAADAVVTFVLVDRATGRSVPVPEAIRAALEERP